MDKKKTTWSILIFLLIITIVYAIEQKTFVNMNLMENSIYNATWVNASYFFGSGEYLTGIVVGNESDLNVNSSLYWDGLDDPSDIYYSNLSASNIDIDGHNITADYFIGDGSRLEGILQGNLILYFLESIDSGTGYYVISSIPNSTEVSITKTGLGVGNTLMGTWITPSNVPNLRLIQAGEFHVRVAGEKTSGTKSAQYFFEVYKTNSTGGDETLIATSEHSNELTGTRQTLDIYSTIPETAMNSTDRIIVKGYVYVSGGGSAPSVVAYIQGTSRTRMEIPVGGVTTERYIPYSGATKNVDLGDYNISATHILQNGSIVVDVSEDYLGKLACSDTQTVEYNDTSGIWECTNMPIGNIPLWEDGGTYLIPNSTYAANVYLPAGFLNVSEWLKVYGDAEIFGNLDVHGDADIIGTLTSGDLSTGQRNFSDEVRAESGIDLKGTITDINSNAKIEYDGGNINFYIG